MTRPRTAAPTKIGFKIEGLIYLAEMAALLAAYAAVMESLARMVRGG